MRGHARIDLNTGQAFHDIVRMAVRRAGVALAAALIALASVRAGHADTPPTDMDVAGALLTIADFPPGWRVGGPLDATAVRSRSCPGAPIAAGVPLAQAGRWFAAGAVSPMVYQDVRQYEVSAAIQAMSALRAGFGDCAWEEVEPGDSPMTFRLQPLTAPPVGDEAVAQRLLAWWDGITVEAEVIVLRRGALLTTLTHVVIGQPATVDGALMWQLAQRADTQLNALAYARQHPSGSN